MLVYIEKYKEQNLERNFSLPICIYFDKILLKLYTIFCNAHEAAVSLNTPSDCKNLLWFVK